MLAEWLRNIQSIYRINPYIFAAIYLSSVPFFWISIYKIIAGISSKNYRQMRVFALVLAAAVIAPFLYVALFGRNLPVWFWLFAALVLAYSAYSVVKRIRRAREKSPAGPKF